MTPTCATASRRMSFIAGVAAAAIAVPAMSVAQPAPEELAAAAGLQLPPWWQVAAVDIQAEVNDGDAIDPRYRQRITVDLSAQEELYLFVDETAPFTVVAPSGIDTHRLYGVASSTLERGEWKTLLDFENLGDLESAAPKTAFKPPVLVSGTDAAQAALDGFMDAQAIVRALAERSAANAASAEIVAELDSAAAARLDAMKARMETALGEIDSVTDRLTAAASAAGAGVVAELDGLAAERLEAMRGRMAAALDEIDSGVDDMIAANRATLEKLASLGEQRVAAAAARADTLLAIAEGKEEIAAQEELSSVLEDLAARIRQNAELEAAGVEAALAADKELQDSLRARLASEDLSERMAAFRHAMAQEDGHLRRIALDAALASGVDEFQGAALAEVVAGLPQLIITVTTADGTYYQTLKVTEAEEGSFSGEMTTDGAGWSLILKVTGTVQGDALRIHAVGGKSGNYVCRWDAAVDGSGVLSGQSMCRYQGRKSRDIPDGIASFSF